MCVVPVSISLPVANITGDLVSFGTAIYDLNTEYIKYISPLGKELALGGPWHMVTASAAYLAGSRMF